MGFVQIGEHTIKCDDIVGITELSESDGSFTRWNTRVEIRLIDGAVITVSMGIGQVMDILKQKSSA